MGSPGRLCFCSGLLKQHLTGDHAEALQHQDGTCKSQLALKKKTRNESSGQQVRSCCFPHVVLESNHAILRGQFQFRNAGVNVWTCPAVSTWHLAMGVLQVWAEGALLPLPATLLSCIAGPLLELPQLLQRDLIPSCDNRHCAPLLSAILPPLPSSPSICALWMMSSSCCLGVHICVDKNSVWVSSPFDTVKMQHLFCLELRINCKQLNFLATS